jgi:hypothetical protein
VRDRKDDLRRQFGTVWKMAQGGFETLREVVVRSSQAGRLRVDVALLHRERARRFQSLGEKTAALAAAGGLELPDDLQSICDEIRDLDVRIRSSTNRLHDNAFGAPRGYEPEAGNFDDLDDDPLDEDEHADVGDATRRETR